MDINKIAQIQADLGIFDSEVSNIIADVLKVLNGNDLMKVQLALEVLHKAIKEQVENTNG